MGGVGALETRNKERKKTLKVLFVPLRTYKNLNAKRKGDALREERARGLILADGTTATRLTTLYLLSLLVWNIYSIYILYISIRL